MTLESVLQTLSEERKPEETNNQLVTRLKNAGKIPNDKLEHYQRTAAAADYYERNEWMHVKQAFQEPLEMVNFLREKRQDESSLSNLALALWTAGKMPNDKLEHYQRTAGAADYALSNQEMIERQIRQAYYQTSKLPHEYGFMAELKRSMDRSLFTQKRDPTKEISDSYFKLVMRRAMVMYGNEIVKN